MKKKRLIKLLMAMGFDRNHAELIAKRAPHRSVFNAAAQHAALGFWIRNCAKKETPMRLPQCKEMSVDG